MELPSPVPDEVPPQLPQDADSDGSSPNSAILHGLDVAGHALAELFSPSRLTTHSGFLGLLLGQAFDLVDGVDLSTVHGRALVWACLKAHRLGCVVVSSPYTIFSRLKALNRKRGPKVQQVTFEDQSKQQQHTLSFCGCNVRV